MHGLGAIARTKQWLGNWRTCVVPLLWEVPNVLHLHSVFGTWWGRAWNYTQRLWSQILRVKVLHDCLCKVYLLYFNGAVGGRYWWDAVFKACHVLSLLILFSWWMGCANMWFCKPFHTAMDRVKWPGFSYPWNENFNTIILTCNQIFMYFGLC